MEIKKGTNKKQENFISKKSYQIFLSKISSRYLLFEIKNPNMSFLSLGNNFLIQRCVTFGPLFAFPFDPLFDAGAFTGPFG